jgi:hypothetical protein
MGQQLDRHGLLFSGENKMMTLHRVFPYLLGLLLHRVPVTILQEKRTKKEGKDMLHVALTKWALCNLWFAG